VAGQTFHFVSGFAFRDPFLVERVGELHGFDFGSVDDFAFVNQLGRRGSLGGGLLGFLFGSAADH
jgi:hypothetical protein